MPERNEGGMRNVMLNDVFYKANESLMVYYNRHDAFEQLYHIFHMVYFQFSHVLNKHWHRNGQRLFSFGKYLKDEFFSMFSCKLHDRSYNNDQIDVFVCHICINSLNNCITETMMNQGNNY